MSSTTNFGLNPAPVGSTSTGAFTNPIIPTPIPSPGIAKGYSGMMNQQSSVNPIIDAASGPKCNIIWASGIDKVLSHPTSPNEQLYFGDENDQIIYVRETDGNGNIKNPIKALHYTVEEMPFGPEAQFVTKEEHKQLYTLVEKLSQNVDSMNVKLEKLLNG